MIDFTQIITQFLELVGYRNENEITLSTSQNKSDSGLFVNDLAGISLQAIDKAGFLKSDLTPEETVTEYLEKIYNAELQVILNDFIFKSENLLKTKSLKFQSFANEFNYTKETSQGDGRFIGFKLYLKNGYNLIAKIKSIVIQLLESQTVKIYLYDLLKQAPISTFDFNFVSEKDAQVQAVTNWILKYQDEISREKNYLIGFYEYDPAMPLPNHQLNSTNKAYSFDFCNYIEDFEIKSIIIPNNKLNYNSVSGVYDLPINAYDSMQIQNYAMLDFNVSIECDYTDILIENKLKFGQALQYNLARRIITDCLFSNEFNSITEQNQKNWNNLILHFNNLLNGYEFIDAQGNSGRKSGILKDLVKSFEGIDKNCFPRRRTMDI